MATKQLTIKKAINVDKIIITDAVRQALQEDDNPYLASLFTVDLQSCIDQRLLFPYQHKTGDWLAFLGLEPFQELVELALTAEQDSFALCELALIVKYLLPFESPITFDITSPQAEPLLIEALRTFLALIEIEFFRRKDWLKLSQVTALDKNFIAALTVEIFPKGLKHIDIIAPALKVISSKSKR